MADNKEKDEAESATAKEPQADAEKKPEQMTEAELRAEMARHFREQKVDDCAGPVPGQPEQPRLY